ncbi:MAG: transporter substrate-binding domain-containing protein [Pseudomonadota bacterium]
MPRNARAAYLPTIATNQMQLPIGAMRCLIMLIVAMVISHSPVSAQGTEAPEAETAAPQTQQPQMPKTLIVGTKLAPPFVYKAEDGSWSGISIDLWRRLALALNRDFEIKEFDTAQGVVDAAAEKEIDIGISALSVTGPRELIADFSHPYYQSGLGIAVATGPASAWVNLLRALSSGPFLATVGMLALLLFATGAVMWLIERRHNPEHFPTDVVRGVGNGFWWSAVTMTTVGYGDKAPVTLLGRAIAVIWMFAALILTAVFTAQLTSALTVQSFAGPVTSVADLGKANVGILEGASSEAYFRDRRQFPQSFANVSAGLAALKSGRIDAFVHDAPILGFEISKGDAKGIELLGDLFETQNYAVVMPQDSSLREPLNQALLEITASDLWPAITSKYLDVGGPQ